MNSHILSTHPPTHPLNVPPPGGPCSCGVWITPAFQFTRSKLDVKPAGGGSPVDAPAVASLIQPLTVMQFAESNGQEERVGEIGR